MFSGLKAILFDFGGTLDADGVPWMERFHALYRAEGLDLDADTFARRFRRADDSLLGGLAQDTGFRATVDILTERLDQALPAGGPARSGRIADRFHHDAETHLARNRPALERLAGRYRLGIVSNFYGNLAAVAEETGIAAHFGVVADSTVVGAEKPDPVIFKAALDGLGVAADHCLFVGDSLRRDRAGADGMGMRFVWIEAPGSARGVSDLPRWRIPGVTELPGVLEERRT